MVPTLGELIQGDYNTLNASPKAKTTLSTNELRGAISYAKEELGRNPSDSILRPWLSIIAQREMDNTAIQKQLDELKDFFDANGQRIIPAPVESRISSGNDTGKSKDEVKTSVDNALSSIDMRDINKMKQGLDKLKLALNIPGLSLSDRDAILGYTGQMLIVRIERAGYKVYLQNNKVVVEPTLQTGDRSISTALSTMLDGDSISLQSIATGLIYNSSEFIHFVAVNTSEVDGKKIVQTPNKDYFEYLRTATGSKKTTSDEALMRSESAVRTTLGLTPDKMQSLMIGYVNTGHWLKANPRVAEQVAQAMVPQSANVPLQSQFPILTTNPSPSPGSNTSAKITQKTQPPSSPPPAPPVLSSTWGENPIGKLFGEAGTSVMNGIGNLVSEPGALAGVLITFIATWIFADFKTALGVIGAATGLSAAYDAYQRNKNGGNVPATQPQGTPNNQTQNPSATLPPLSPVPLSSIDQKNLSLVQQKGLKALETHESQIQNAIAMRYKSSQGRFNASMKEYVDFIHSPGFQGQKLSGLIFNTDATRSIFTESKAMGLTANRPANIDPAILKLILRGYLGIGINPSGTPNTPDWGKKEKDEFMQKASIHHSWTDKNFSELVTQTHK